MKMELAKSTLKKGDRVGITKCPGTKRTFIFSHWDGLWMVSKSGIDDYHPNNIYSINGKAIKESVCMNEEEIKAN